MARNVGAGIDELRLHSVLKIEFILPSLFITTARIPSPQRPDPFILFPITGCSPVSGSAGQSISVSFFPSVAVSVTLADVSLIIVCEPDILGYTVSTQRLTETHLS